MRIRRRPQAPAPAPSSSPQPPSDPSVSAVTRTPLNAGAVARDQQRLDEDGSSSARPHLGEKPSVARRLALPTSPPPLDNAEDCFRILGDRKGGVDVHSSCSMVINGQRRADRIEDNAACTGGGGGVSTGMYEWAAKVEGAARNGVAAKEEARGSGGGAGGAKKRRSSAVLVEGSRCSRVNGRGWRCSQPTLLGYALCEHHLGKGRTAASSGRAGAGQLGRTEHAPRIPTIAVTAAALLAPSPRRV